MKHLQQNRIRPVGFLACLGLFMLLLNGGMLSAQKSKIKQKYKYSTSVQTTEDGKYSYTVVSGDPMRSRVYTLKNGLQVYMTVNKNAPRVSTAIAVRTGSNNDPEDATGLAHYLEHMLFKGTDKYGSLDYEKEKVLLDQIEELYEKYRAETDEAKRKEIYAEIDRVSGEAAKFAIASEYDKMLAAIGAKGTNAFTSFEQTVYVNDIPSNQLEKWLKIEGERFRNPVLRLFHTELEAVYEEKNISLDSDRRSAYFQMLEGLFKEHNYGQQTTIGTVEHLKNPSIKKIKEYYSEYYVPNNMAICLSGDLDPDATIAVIDKYFGHFKSQPVTPYESPEEAPMEGVQEFEVTGPDAAMLYMGFRVPGVHHEDAPVIEMIDYMLSNSTAGLIDLNLVKKQKVLMAFSFNMSLKDYGVHALGGVPLQGQTLEDLKEMLLQQVEFIKQGEFEDGLIQAVVNNMEIEEIERHEENRGRAMDFVDSYIYGQEWSDYIQKLEKMRKITQEDVIRVANKYYGENYVVVYKRTGERQNKKKVVKPEITPVEVNREDQSPFVKDIYAMDAPKMSPVFLDYEKDMSIKQLDNGIPLHHVKNEENQLFNMYYLLPFGKKHDREMALAIEYLPFLGTDKYSAEDISKRFYELGTSFDVFTSMDEIYVIVTGLQKNFKPSVELFEHLLKNAKADPAAYQGLVKRIQKERADLKLNKSVILRQGLINYGKYGKTNPFNDVLSNEELAAVKAEDLVARLQGLTDYKHKVLYYGPETPENLITDLNTLHKTPASLKAAPVTDKYKEMEPGKSKVYFVEYDMVQAEIGWLTRSVQWDPKMVPTINMFNQYYGGNMSSIVFQTIRESKALAYSTYSSFVQPRTSQEHFFVMAYVGTQADKIHEAIAGMNELLNECPRSDNLFDNSKVAIKNKMETERIIKSSILFSYENATRKGTIGNDLRKATYESLDGMDFEKIQEFHKNYISGQNYNLLVLGSKDKIDLKSLEKYGEVVELSLEDVFGY